MLPMPMNIPSPEPRLPGWSDWLVSAQAVILVTVDNWSDFNKPTILIGPWQTMHASTTQKEKRTEIKHK